MENDESRRKTGPMFEGEYKRDEGIQRKPKPLIKAEA
jgi:hypothetical protein